MEQLRALWERLTLRQRLTLGAVALAVVGGLYALIEYQKAKDFKPLFTQLAPEDAGHLTAKLKEKAVPYKVSDDGTALLVPSARLAELRLELAAEGLPRSGRIGFELFDKTNFGLTEFAEQINYQRALEGELERTIGTLREVEHSRVHLTLAKKSVFVSERRPAKASVVLKLRPGARLHPSSVQAVAFMLSSAVEDLAPENISVIDQNGSLLSRPRKSMNADEEMPEILMEYRQRVEKDLLRKVTETLDPLLGEGKYRAGITVDVDMTSGESSEETFDPDKAVVLSEQKTEDVSGIPLASGVPGTPSNLPRPTSRPAGAQSGTQRKTESTNYQASRTVRRMKLPQGGLKRVSLSVLLDQTVRWEGQGAKAKRVFETASPEKIKTIKDVLSAATGLVPERGDVVIVESLPFDSTLRQEAPLPPAPPAPPKPLFDIPPPLLNYLPAPLKDPAILLAALAGAALLLILLAVLVLWFLRKKKAPKSSVSQAHAEVGSSGAPGALPEGDGRSFEERLAEQQDLQKRLEQTELQKLKLPHVSTQKGKILAQHITDEAKKDPINIAHILRTWLHEER